MFWICPLGQTDYEAAFKLQIDLREKRLRQKIPNLLLFTSHPPIFTLGRRNCQDDFISPPELIRNAGIRIIPSNRGGKITYHGPGQIVGYFIADIRSLKLSIPEFVRKTEEILIRTLSSFGLQTHRDPEHPGVWLGNKKLAAIGLHFDRGVSMHGFALNVNPNLEHYRHIIPCGIRDKTVSSMEAELGREMEKEEVEKEIFRRIKPVFNEDPRWVEKGEL